MPIPDKMRLFIPAIVPLGLVFSAASVRATTYAPVTFSELVDRAEVIFVGDVVDVRPYTMRVRDNTIIKTRVTFSVSDPIFGTTSLVEVFDFLGGETGGVGMAVAGMPTFAIGDRRVVFARRDRSINPIVGFTQGLLQVRPDDNGVDRVLTEKGAPLVGPESIGAFRRGGYAALSSSMRLADFRGRVAQALAEAHKK